MTSEKEKRRLAEIVGELKDLHPRFVAAIERSDRSLAADAHANPADIVKEQPDYWVKTAYRNALIRARLILENNFLCLETLNILAVTRYVFELLVWMRLLDSDPEYGLIFYGRVLSGQIQHAKSLRKKLEDEIELFEELQKEELNLHLKSIEEISAGPELPSADHFRLGSEMVMSELDRKARRFFALYADQAKHNGFGFQAALIRENVLPKIDATIHELEEERMALVAGCPKTVRDNLDGYWKWRKEAVRVGMEQQYDFIYSFTSRLLHATPASFYTNQKNLESTEMIMFLDYVYVSMLDILDLAKSQFGSEETFN